MPIETDVSVSAAGDIRWAAGGAGDGPYTVLELHRFLMDLADDAVASGDDLLDITYGTPSERSTDQIITLLNGYNIDATMAEHLYNGSITQASGAERYSGLVVVGSVNSGSTQLQIVQNNVLLTNYWGTGLNADAANNILLRILVLTRTGGADIDGGRVRVQARELGDTYSEFVSTLGLGNGTAAILTTQDLNNQTAIGTIAAFTISNTEGLNAIDIDDDGSTENYYSQWDRGVHSINDLYEYTKWIQRRGTAQTIYGMNGELFRGITHSIVYDNEASGPFTEPETLTFGNGATAQLLAVEDAGATGTLHVQLLTGVAPSDNDTIIGGTSGATADVNGAPTARVVPPNFLGTSSGSAIVGAYGVGVEFADLTNNDQLFDLTDTQRVPPNNVSFAVQGLVAGEDYVLVGPEDGGGGLDTAQDTVNGALIATATSVVVTAAIPSDTPQSGTIRLFNGNTFDRIEYSSYTGSTYTVDAVAHPTGIPNAIGNGADMFISYIDEVAAATSASFTSVYNADRTLFIRVRDGGASPIKTFETTGTLSSSGGSATAIRTSDA